jgi:hypothetical protein
LQFRVGAPDPSLTASAGLLAVAEFAGRVGLIEALDAAVPGSSTDAAALVWASSWPR